MHAIVVERQIPQMLAVKALRPIWPGVIWSPLSPAKVVDLGQPPLPGPHWLRVRNRQCGICATDLNMLFVRPQVDIGPAALPGNQRFYLGHEVVGEIIEVGPEVSRFREGDRVVMESRFAGRNCFTQEIEPPCHFCAQGQTRLCENASLGRGPVGVGGGWGDGYIAHQAEVRRVPQGLDDDQASLIEPMAVALHGVLRHPPEPGQKVLIIGAGVIGLMTCQAAKILVPHCHLTVLARYPQQEELARNLGADTVVIGDDLYPEMARISGAKLYRSPFNRGMLLGGFEVVYDCVGKAETITDALRWARAGGAVVMIGISLSSLRVDLNPIWYQEVDLIGSYTFGIETWQGQPVHTFDLVANLMLQGQIKHQGLITHRFPFEDYRQAISVASDKRTGSIKVAFTY